MESLVGSASTVSPWHYFHDGNVQQEKLINRIIDDEQSLSASSSICHLCNSYSTIFDGLTGETICSNCATVISDRQITIENDPNIKSKLGQPTSLAFPDKGLSSVITSSNTDAYGTSLNQDQISSVNKIRYYNKLSGSGNHGRNLRNAFAAMATIKDKLTLTDPVVERAAYYYRH